MASVAASDAVAPLSSPLLAAAPTSVDSSAKVANSEDQAAGHPGLVRRFAAWHGPDPATALAATLFLAAGAHCLESVWRGAASNKTMGAPGSGVHVGEATQVSSDGSLIFVDPAASGLLSGFTFLELLMYIVVSTVVSLALVQHFGERLLLRGIFGEAFGGRTDVKIIGTVRAWLLLGKIVARNVVLYGNKGSDSPPYLTVRHLTAQIGIKGCLNAYLTGRVDVSDLRIDGVDVVLNESSDWTFLSSAGRNQPSSQYRSIEVLLESVDIENVVVRKLVPTEAKEGFYSTVTAAAPERHFQKFSKEMRVGYGVDEVIVALAKTIATDASAAISTRAAN